MKHFFIASGCRFKLVTNWPGLVVCVVQSLQNLITNAVKYSGQNRWLRISARTARHETTPGEIELTVEDRGIGIDPDELKHIFEPFYRSPAVAESGIHGTGLGLPLTRKIVEAMGGRVTAQSELGQGSSFTIHLLRSHVRLTQHALFVGIVGR